MISIRQQILKAVGQALSENVTIEEVAAIVFYLEECVDELQKIDVSKLLMDLLRDQRTMVLKHLSELHDTTADRYLKKNNLQNVTLSVTTSNFVQQPLNRYKFADSFLFLLRSTEEKVRVIGLQAIRNLLLTRDLENYQELFVVMDRSLREHSFNTPCFQELFSMMLGDDYTTATNGSLVQFNIQHIRNKKEQQQKQKRK